MESFRMDNNIEKKVCKAGRKPIYTEERARIGFRCNMSLQEDLNKLISIMKEKDIRIDGKEATINDYVVSVLTEKVNYDLFRLKK